jgi:hypothetical protein
VRLWEAVQHIQLDTSREDTVVWRWTANGECTSKSAYNIQFEGSYIKLRIMPIWKARAESKCRIFAWTLLHKKILTANNLIKRNWPNDPICKLCGVEPENPTHLCKDCTFSKQVWGIIKTWFGLSTISTVGDNGSLHGYLRRCRSRIDKPHKRSFDGIMIYFWWNNWKERNRRTFQKQKPSTKWSGTFMQRRGRSIQAGNKTNYGRDPIELFPVVVCKKNCLWFVVEWEWKWSGVEWGCVL